jgi:hypothetical protein
MTTLRQPGFVSIAALMLVLALGACVRAPSASVSHGPAAMDAGPLAFRFDNDGRDHVHVYLIGAGRQWLLGRVEQGAVVTLRIPEEAMAGSAFVRLAVLRGEPVTLDAARHPRATLTVAQPGSAILSQRWTYSQGGLTSLGR